MNRPTLMERYGHYFVAEEGHHSADRSVRRCFRVASEESGAEIAADRNATIAHAARVRGGDRSGLVRVIAPFDFQGPFYDVHFPEYGPEKRRYPR